MSRDHHNANLGGDIDMSSFGNIRYSLLV